TAPAPAQTTALKPPAPAFTAAERAAFARVSEASIRAVTTDLAAPAMEGRGTAQPGGARAAEYLAAWMKRLGLEPLGEGGSYLQPIPFRSALVLAGSSVVAGQDTLRLGADFVSLAVPAGEQVVLEGPLVFVGYGISSTALGRDDLAGVDLRGGIAVLLRGQPRGVDSTAWQAQSGFAKVLAGLAARGAIAAILVAGGMPAPYAAYADIYGHRRVSVVETGPAGEEPELPRLLISEAAAGRLWASSAGGSDFAQARTKAESGVPVSRTLGSRATITLKSVIETREGSNVAGVLRGSDPKLRGQAVIYTAHYDAFGVGADGRIYPGAADNALGTAMMLAAAEALTKAPTRPRRSIIFLSVTAEEYGLLGAEYWAGHPQWPLQKIVADLNFDGIGSETYGPVKQVVAFGREYSDLGRVFEQVVAAAGGTVIEDPFPEEGAFYRSDHFAFVKQGVPALMLLGAPRDPGWLHRAKAWLNGPYHQPGDSVRTDWDWSGPRTLAGITLVIGLRLANQDAVPAWLPNSPFQRPH
ncbi:MAG: M20/M25/M40 family metallo-hydrolase, partial [Gemmatimonadales bacterium]